MSPDNEQRSTGGDDDFAERPLCTSRFASARWERGRLVVTSLRAGMAIECDDVALLVVLDCFRSPRTPAEVARDPAVAEIDDVVELARQLYAREILVPAGCERRPPHDEGPYEADSFWAVPELGLQVHSREAAPAGSDGFRFHGRARWEPAVKPPMGARRLALPPPPPPPEAAFWDLVRRRRSIRRADGPIALAALSCFLHWTARNWDEYEAPGGETLVHRLYPSGGSLYAHEVYPVVPEGAVEGLGAGVYHYCPRGHALEVLPVEDEAATAGSAAPVEDEAATADASASANTIDSLVEIARRISAPPPSYDGVERDPGERSPRVLLLITTRIARAAHKYDHIAYATQLKDVGCLFAHFYLVATALGLAPCAYGGGFPTRLLARVTGVDPLREPIVGEFGLGAASADAASEFGFWPGRDAPRGSEP
ncbi:nitroreductase family protein [Haliangium sp.]|uniref:nitroreductase family protein n=1 Tax=Haliangium sp. TaxID=2663208 RepID=UPI003D0A54E1